MNKQKDNWFDEHIMVMGNDAKLNEAVKDKIKKEMPMIVKNLKVDTQVDYINDSSHVYKLFPIDKLEELLLFLKELEGEIGDTAFNVSFQVCDYESEVDE